MLFPNTTLVVMGSKGKPWPEKQKIRQIKTVASYKYSVLSSFQGPWLCIYGIIKTIKFFSSSENAVTKVTTIVMISFSFSRTKVSMYTGEDLSYFTDFWNPITVKKLDVFFWATLLPLTPVMHVLAAVHIPSPALYKHGHFSPSVCPHRVSEVS